MQVNWSKIITNPGEQEVWQQFVERKISARRLDAFAFKPTVKTLVNKLGCERLRDLARKALLRRS